MCPKGHTAKKVEIQVQTTELEFWGGERGEGHNAQQRKGRAATGELHAMTGPCPSLAANAKTAGKRSHTIGNRKAII